MHWRAAAERSVGVPFFPRGTLVTRSRQPAQPRGTLDRKTHAQPRGKLRRRGGKEGTTANRKAGPQQVYPFFFREPRYKSEPADTAKGHSGMKGTNRRATRGNHSERERGQRKGGQKPGKQVKVSKSQGSRQTPLGECRPACHQQTDQGAATGEQGRREEGRGEGRLRRQRQSSHRPRNSHRKKEVRPRPRSTKESGNQETMSFFFEITEVRRHASCSATTLPRVPHGCGAVSRGFGLSAVTHIQQKGGKAGGIGTGPLLADTNSQPCR